MFDILDTFCARTDMSHYSTEARRTPGHLSERLFNIYLNHLLAARPELRVKELQCVLITDTTPQEREFRPAFAKNNIPVVFAANNNFVPMFAACFRSFLDHCSEEYNYDVVLIERDITADNRAKLAAMTKGADNVSLRFYDPGRILQHFKLKANAHISVETYFRFLIQSILPDYDKVLYLDCDTIINADVAELYNTDIEGYMLAAVRDVDFLGQINGANKKTLKYVTEEFHMQDPYNYFQAGVLLFNEKEMKKAHSVNEWLTFASTPYMYNDQDVLNLYCEGHVKYLDMAWNLITDCDHTRVKDVIVHAPDQVQKEYAAAHANPKIIHYAGYMKPWHRPTEDYAEYFWSALRRTDFYEVLLFRMSEGITYWQINDHGTQTGPAHLRVLNTLMPLGSNRRKALDGIYVKMFGR
jgi:lipopolysaccharide biosynthesis glycosyltransferase